MIKDLENELTPPQIASSADDLLSESVSNEEKAEFLSALSQRGETPGEIAGFVESFLERAVDPQLDKTSFERPLLDVCGTGGDKLDLFNVSTTSIFVLAACGVAVVKHGNRAITSSSGGADVLEALGIRIDLPPEDFSKCVREVGAGFLFAPMYHPTFKAVGPVRAELAKQGQRTIFNILGPLLNPVRPDYQLIGVFNPALPPAFAEILKKLGRKRAWAVHGETENGAAMDEISVSGTTTICSTDEKSPTHITPQTYGITPTPVSELTGGDAKENATLLRGILSGEITGGKRDIVALNAAAGLVITGLAADLAEGLSLATEAIDSGAATEKLHQWVAFSA